MNLLAWFRRPKVDPVQEFIRIVNEDVEVRWPFQDWDFRVRASREPDSSCVRLERTR